MDNPFYLDMDKINKAFNESIKRCIKSLNMFNKALRKKNITPIPPNQKHHANCKFKSFKNMRKLRSHKCKITQ